MEKFDHPLRTVRIAEGRNTLLKLVHIDFNEKRNRINTKLNKDALLLILDLDDVNTHPLNMSVIDTVLKPENFDEWDALTFNRVPFYDIWSLR